jgi:ATP/maltotriose-dependent transcriptional regulator MalT
MGYGMEDGSGLVLVATKLRPPPVRDQVVPRERLVERLRAGSERRLTLAQA